MPAPAQPEQTAHLDPMMRAAENLRRTIERDFAACPQRQAALRAIDEAVQTCASIDRTPDVANPADEDLAKHRVARIKAAAKVRRAK